MYFEICLTKSAISIMKNFFFVAFILAILVSSCTPNDEGVLQNSVSGEDLFKAVLFANGGAAKRIPSYKESLSLFNNYAETNPDAYKAYLDFINEITTEIKVANPSFFDDFKKHIVSDNYFEMDQALRGALQTFQYTGLHSKKYSYAFTKSQEIKKDIENNIDLSKIDPKSPEGKKVINDYINKKYQEDLQLTDGDKTARGLCIVAYAVIAVVVWEVGGVVNVVTLINVHNAVFVHMLVYGEVDVYGPEKLRSPSGKATNEYQNLIVELAENF
jgi:hypothetical protein